MLPPGGGAENGRWGARPMVEGRGGEQQAAAARRRGACGGDWLGQGLRAAPCCPAALPSLRSFPLSLSCAGRIRRNLQDYVLQLNNMDCKK